MQTATNKTEPRFPYLQPSTRYVLVDADGLDVREWVSERDALEFMPRPGDAIVRTLDGCVLWISPTGKAWVHVPH
jgi:hypothetical protein